MPLPDPIVKVLTVCATSVYGPNMEKTDDVVNGTIQALGLRTVSTALCAKGLDQALNWSSLHQVINRARWSPLAVSSQLLLLIIKTYMPA